MDFYPDDVMPRIRLRFEMRSSSRIWNLESSPQTYIVLPLSARSLPHRITTPTIADVISFEPFYHDSSSCDISEASHASASLPTRYTACPAMPCLALRTAGGPEDAVALCAPDISLLTINALFLSFRSSDREVRSFV